MTDAQFNTTWAGIVAQRLRATHRPHRMMKTVDGLLWETISYPWADDHGRVLVNVRVPGDPTTLLTVRADTMDPEGRDCYCEAAGQFYFRDTPENAEKRAAAVQQLARLL